MGMVGVIVGGDVVGDGVLDGVMGGVAVGMAVGGPSVGDRIVGVGVSNGPQATIARKRIEITVPRTFLVFINSLRSGRRGSRLPPASTKPDMILSHHAAPQFIGQCHRYCLLWAWSWQCPCSIAKLEGWLFFRLPSRW